MGLEAHLMGMEARQTAVEAELADL